ncbi:hypothetical protein JXD20_00990 [Candidatus Peregrinibacteria bacterium]|nr:hypothetical protein [Candidatus Peregrinibacteria bacterium]
MRLKTEQFADGHHELPISGPISRARNLLSVVLSSGLISGSAGCTTKVIYQKPTPAQLTIEPSVCDQNETKEEPVQSEEPELPPDTYEVTLRCDFDEALEAGNYERIAYPFSEVSKKIEPPEAECVEGEKKQVRLLVFDAELTNQEAISKIDEAGYQPAAWTELLALGAQYPDLQKDFAIYALGSVWEEFPDGFKRYPYLVTPLYVSPYHFSERFTAIKSWADKRTFNVSAHCNDYSDLSSSGWVCSMEDGKFEKRTRYLAVPKKK